MYVLLQMWQATAACWLPHQPRWQAGASSQQAALCSLFPLASPAAGLDPSSSAPAASTAQMAVLRGGKLVLQPLPVQTQAGEESKSLQSRIRPWAVAAAFLLGIALVVAPARVLGDLFDVRCAPAGLPSTASADDVLHHNFV